MDMKINSDKVIDLRKQRAWSQQHLSDVSGISLRTIQRVENTNASSLDTIRAIASAFDLRAHDLTIAEQPEKPKKTLRVRMFAFAALILSIVGSVLMTSLPTTASSLSINATSMSVDQKNRRSIFKDNVSIFIPNDVNFEIRLEEQSSITEVAFRHSSFIVQLEEGTLRFTDANIKKTEAGTSISTEHATLTSTFDKP